MPAFTSEKDEGQETYGQKKILFCPYCGTRLDDGARFCKNCGAQVEKTNPLDTKTGNKNMPEK